MHTYSFNPFPVLETPRLVLRRPIETDAADLLEMRSDPEVMQYIPRPLARSEEDVLELLRMLDTFIDNNERINWAIEWKETGKVLGMIGYVHTKQEHARAEVGYSLSRAWHRKGIMREALHAVMEYGFHIMKLHSIEAIIDAENTASGRLLEDVGFTREAYFREDFLHNGKFRNSIHYGFLHYELKPALQKATPMK